MAVKIKAETKGEWFYQNHSSLCQLYLVQNHLLQSGMLNAFSLLLPLFGSRLLPLTLSVVYSMLYAGKFCLTGTKLKDFLETMQSTHFQSEIAKLRHDVEEYAKQFPTIGFEKATMKYKN